MTTKVDLFGVNGPDFRSRGEPTDEISIAQFWTKYRFGKNTPFQVRHRLTQALQTTEWWRNIGCTLCFVTDGNIEPDHELSSCHRGEQLALVNRALHWLKDLDIPTDSYPGRGFCSFCWLFHPCSYVADANFDCDRRSIILEVIAVLSTHQKHTLGHVVADLATYQHGVDLATDDGTRSWLQSRVPFKDYSEKDLWYPNLLLAYEALVVSFYYQQNSARGVEPLLGFPWHPAGRTEPPTATDEDHRSIPEDWKEESEGWSRAIAWWSGKCGFCAGRNLTGQWIQHTLRQCTRGGKSALSSQIGEALYEDGILPSSGCHRCHLPFPICGAWSQDGVDEGVTQRPGTPQCRYSPLLLQDTIIGLLGSGNASLRDCVEPALEDYCIGEDLPMSWDGETIARALSRDVTSEDNVVGSEMICLLWHMTEALWRDNGSK